MFRIKKEPKGFIVEYKIYKWTLFGLKEIWKPYVLTSGMDCAWHHSTSEFAIMNFKKQVHWELLDNTDFYFENEL